MLLSLTASLVLVGCNNREAQQGTITDIQDLSKVYDGVAVSNPTFTSNNKNPKVEITFFEKGSATEIAAPTNAGEYTVKIALQQFGDVLAVSATKDFVISKADAVFAQQILLEGYTYSPTQTLADISLQAYANVSWKDESIVPTCDVSIYKAIYSPDKTNYNDVELDVTLQLAKATPSYTVPQSVGSLVGDKLQDIDISVYGLAWEQPQTVISASGTFAAKTTADLVNYNQVSVEIFVKVVANAVEMPTLNASFVYDGTEKSISISDIVNYNSEVMEIADSSVFSAVGAGEYTVIVSLKDTDCYCWSNRTNTDLHLVWQIAKATPQAPSQVVLDSVTYSPSQTLANISLPQGFSWQDETVVPTCDTTIYAAIYNPDSANYNNLPVTIQLTVERAEPTYTLPTNLTGETGKSLSTVSLPDGFSWTDSQAEIADGANSYNALYTPTDTTNYKTANVAITVVGSNVSYPFEIVCASGTENCYTVEENDSGEYTVTFTTISQKSEYQLKGELVGNVVVDVGDDYKFELSLVGATITSYAQSPIAVLSGDQVTVSAKNGYTSYINDKRDAVTDEAVYSSAIYSKVDLVIGGKGSLTLVSDNNNGIHTKKDLEVKNLMLSVTCKDNALKGNDSVTITSGTLTLVASQGDGIKTTDSDISSKGNQRGTIKILDGSVTVYAACDGIDAAYNVEIVGGELNIFTDKYSQYSEEVTAVSEGFYYIRYSNKNYNYSVKYYNDSTDYIWKNATYYTSVVNGRTTYYYYKVDKPAGYTNMTLYVYSTSQQQGQDTDYIIYKNTAVNNNYDTMAVSSSGSVSWTNYTTSTNPGGGGFPGGGGMQEGNPDKGDYSTKGLKADNEILISGGTINIKSYDDAIHTNNTTLLGDPDDASTQHYGTGNIEISGGTLTLYSNDDGIHADASLTITGGTIKVTNSYEGLEGANIYINGGDISIISTDDGVNATATSGQGLVINDGTLYVYAGGDGLDANSKTSYQGIVFAGGKVVVINTSGGNSPIDTEAGYKYTGGYVVAIGSSGGMWSESTKCNSSSGFSSVGCYKSNVASANYITVSGVATVKMPKTMTSVVIVLGGGTNTSIISTSSSSSETFDADGVCWKV